MIVFDLVCTAHEHRFEGWFANSESFEEQRARGLVRCPHCDCGDVGKALMAPNLGRKGNQVVSAPAAPAPVQNQAANPKVQELMRNLAQLQAESLRNSRWVGDGFADQSRAMHYGERDSELIHGQATIEEAKALLEEGIAVAPLPFPVAPPDELN